MSTGALLEAAGAGDTAAVRALLAEGADIGEKSSHGETALMRAASHGHVETVRVLLDAGSDVNAQAEDGMTALMRAAFFGRPRVAQALLDQGADPSVVDRTGMTAAGWARARGELEVLKILDRCGAPDARTSASERGVEGAAAPEANAESRPETFGAGAGGAEVRVPDGPAAGGDRTSGSERGTAPRSVENLSSLAGEADVTQRVAEQPPRPGLLPPEASAALTQRAGEARDESAAGQADPAEEDVAADEVTQAAVPKNRRWRRQASRTKDPEGEFTWPAVARPPDASHSSRPLHPLKYVGLFLVLTLGFAAVTWVILEGLGISFVDPGASSPATSPVEQGAAEQSGPAETGAGVPIRDGQPQPGSPQSEDGALTAALGDWVAATIAKDIDRQMGFYASRLHTFYTRRNVSSEAVRKEKVGLFAKAQKVQISTGEPEIKYGRDGRTARMRFRKAYLIEAERGTRRGEVVQDLFWRKGDGGWKIVGERDVRVVR